MAIALAGFVEELESQVPEHLAEWISAEPMLRSMHSVHWWRSHWEQTGIVDIKLADSMTNGWQLWLQWLNAIAPDNQLEIQALQADGGRHLKYNRVIACRKADVQLEEALISIPSNYEHTPLLRQ